PGAEAILTDVNLDFAMVESQMAIIRSSVFLRRVVEKEQLVSDPEFGTRRAAPQPASGAGSDPAKADEGKPEDGSRHATAEQQAVPSDLLYTVERLKGAVSVARAGQGHVLAISVTSRDPARAARLANAVADAFLVDKLDTRFEAAKRASAWLSDRLAELRTQLRESEEAVAQFRAENGLVQASANVTLGQQQLSELNAKLVASRTDTAEKKARLDLLRSIEAKGGDAQSVPDLAGSGSALMSLRGQLATISQREADLLSRYSDRHPQVVNVRAERRDVERAIAAETKQLGARIRNEYELAKAR